VQPVLLDVSHVVHEVDRAGKAAEDQEGEDGAQQRAGLEEVLAQRQGREEDQVLRPLVRPEGNEERLHVGRCFRRRRAARSS
jgi:hypothetical protein